MDMDLDDLAMKLFEAVRDVGLVYFIGEKAVSSGGMELSYRTSKGNLVGVFEHNVSTGEIGFSTCTRDYKTANLTLTRKGSVYNPIIVGQFIRNLLELTGVVDESSALTTLGYDSEGFEAVNMRMHEDSKQGNEKLPLVIKCIHEHKEILAEFILKATEIMDGEKREAFDLDGKLEFAVGEATIVFDYYSQNEESRITLCLRGCKASSGIVFNSKTANGAETSNKAKIIGVKGMRSFLEAVSQISQVHSPDRRGRML